MGTQKTNTNTNNSNFKLDGDGLERIEEELLDALDTDGPKVAAILSGLTLEQVNEIHNGYFDVFAEDLAYAALAESYVISRNEWQDSLLIIPFYGDDLSETCRLKKLLEATAAERDRRRNAVLDA
jgi:hypothetical protein